MIPPDSESPLRLYQSNRLETLFSALCATLAEPLADPLAPEIVVVQNPGMARWLSQHIALETGIAAHFEFPLPATFIWNIFKETLGELPDLSGFDRSVLLWRIPALLDELLSDPSMAEIAGYLQGDDDDSRKFQLAGKITDIFDQYLVYRPDLLAAWENGDDKQWQSLLWRRLTTDNAMHRAALFHRFIETAEAGLLSTQRLPQRVCFFGLNSLAPASLSVIEQISPLVNIHIFHLSPCKQAWDDIMPERLLAVKRQKWCNQNLDDISSYFSTGNPLLASMGAMGQEFFSLLMQLDHEDLELYEQPDTTSLLGTIQEDILTLHDRTRTPSPPPDPTDNSIAFHCCHSPMREIQVLHDRLLDLFAADPDLKPADILVMAPDINGYAPFVSGVFGSAAGNLQIPWSIADRQGSAGQPVIEGFLGLLELVSSRFTAPEVTALLENPAILHAFNLQEQDFSVLRTSIRNGGIRWGLNQNQRKAQGTDDSNLHTWDFGLQRLLLGYITGPMDAPVQDIMPCSSTLNDTGTWLGSLTDFISKLQALQQTLRKPHTPESWAEILQGLLQDFLTGTATIQDQDGLLTLRAAIADFSACCAKAEFNEPISLAIIRSHFNSQLAEPAGGQAFLSGRVTFCNMVPMRSVPFKVIWLLGMNDMDYPRSQRPPAFDLMAAHPRLGDRSRRDDDRYLFLESILSARSQLAISWIGRDQQENRELPPSVVVAELRDYIDRGWPSGLQDTATSQLLTTQYPLQPFSRRCFDGNPKTASYAALWLPALDNPPDNVFINKPLPAPDHNLQEIDLARLVRFWNHPVRFFLEQCLGLRLHAADELLPESESFALDFLEQYLLGQKLVTTLLKGDDLQVPFQRLLAAGDLPRAGFGKILFHDMSDTATALVDNVKPLIAEPAEAVEINLQFDDILLKGWLNALYSTGRVSCRPATLKARDLLQLWIQHLVLCLRRPADVALNSFHAATDTIICFQEVDDAKAQLHALLNRFCQGHLEPLHFYPKTSHAWAATDDDHRMKKAEASWYSGWTRGEEEDPAYALALRGLNPLDDQFEQLAALFLPIIAATEVYHAAP